MPAPARRGQAMREALICLLAILPLQRGKVEFGLK
jgi:hypothetical protein